MSVTIEQLSDKLHQKQTELIASLARLKSEVLSAGEPEVRDESDSAEATQSSAETAEQISLESATLEQVEDALKRMDNGTYGKCVVCGRPIPDARLEAIPWTPYCIEDQEKMRT
jgi:DnaK suppressor protein